MPSKGMLRKAKGDHLDPAHSDQKVLEMIRQGEAGFCYRKPRVSKLTQRILSGLSSLRSDGSRESQVGGWSI
jgi:hypothetical protein